MKLTTSYLLPSRGMLFFFKTFFDKKKKITYTTIKHLDNYLNI